MPDQEPLTPEYAAIRQALADDAWEGHDEPLTSDDLDRIAEVAAAAVRRLTLGELRREYGVAPGQSVFTRFPEAFDERQRPVCGVWNPLLGPCVCGNPDGHSSPPAPEHRLIGSMCSCGGWSAQCGNDVQGQWLDHVRSVTSSPGEQA